MCIQVFVRGYQSFVCVCVLLYVSPACARVFKLLATAGPLYERPDLCTVCVRVCGLLSAVAGPLYGFHLTCERECGVNTGYETAAGPLYVSPGFIMKVRVSMSVCK